jgi:hypothetical protein
MSFGISLRKEVSTWGEIERKKRGKEERYGPVDVKLWWGKEALEPRRGDPSVPCETLELAGVLALGLIEKNQGLSPLSLGAYSGDILLTLQRMKLVRSRKGNRKKGTDLGIAAELLAQETHAGEVGTPGIVRWEHEDPPLHRGHSLRSVAIGAERKTGKKTNKQPCTLWENKVNKERKRKYPNPWESRSKDLKTASAASCHLTELVLAMLAIGRLSLWVKNKRGKGSVLKKKKKERKKSKWRTGVGSTWSGGKPQTSPSVSCWRTTHLRTGQTGETLWGAGISIEGSWHSPGRKENKNKKIENQGWWWFKERGNRDWQIQEWHEKRPLRIVESWEDGPRETQYTRL